MLLLEGDLRAALDFGGLIAVAGWAKCPDPSWLAAIHMAGGGPADPAETAPERLGLLLAFGAIPRIVAGPVLSGVEGAAILR